MKGIERGITMKIKNINNVDKFFEVVDSCKGKVELVTGEGDRLNLKSKLCQYVFPAERSRSWKLSLLRKKTLINCLTS